MSSNQLPTDSIRLIGNENLTTIQSYLLAEDQRHDSESETFTWVLSAISLAAKFIAAKVRRVSSAIPETLASSSALACIGVCGQL